MGYFILISAHLWTFSYFKDFKAPPNVEAAMT